MLILFFYQKLIIVLNKFFLNRFSLIIEFGRSCLQGLRLWHLTVDSGHVTELLFVCRMHWTSEHSAMATASWGLFCSQSALYGLPCYSMFYFSAWPRCRWLVARCSAKVSGLVTQWSPVQIPTGPLLSNNLELVIYTPGAHANSAFHPSGVGRVSGS